MGFILMTDKNVSREINEKFNVQLARMALTLGHLHLQEVVLAQGTVRVLLREVWSQEGRAWILK